MTFFGKFLKIFFKISKIKKQNCEKAGVIRFWNALKFNFDPFSAKKTSFTRVLGLKNKKNRLAIGKNRFFRENGLF